MSKKTDKKKCKNMKKKKQKYKNQSAFKKEEI